MAYLRSVWVSSRTPSTCHRAPRLSSMAVTAPLRLRPHPCELLSANCIVLPITNCTGESWSFLRPVGPAPRTRRRRPPPPAPPSGRPPAPACATGCTAPGRTAPAGCDGCPSNTKNAAAQRHTHHLNLLRRSEKNSRKLPIQPGYAFPTGRCRPKPSTPDSQFTRFKHSRTRYSMDSSTPSPVFALVSK
jgi:hypothetical protein